MELPVVVWVIMFALPVLAMLAIFLLARNWTTPVEHPEEDEDRESGD